MPTVSGVLRKMAVELDPAKEHVQYALRLGEERVPLNAYLGKDICLKFDGEIHCTHCDRLTKKSFSQGFCYPCFRRLAQCDTCIMKPEKCHYDEGTCREPEWADEHCMRSHYVYFANTSGLKVGITRDTQIPTRWIDQGATSALPIIEVGSRYISGLVEVLFAQHVADKTAWQAMLKGEPVEIDLKASRDHWRERLAEEVAEIAKEVGEQNVQWLDEEVETAIQYPVLNYPTKVSSLNFDKTPEVAGCLQGIKGQYLMLDTGVINMRKFGGYDVTFSAA